MSEYLISSNREQCMLVKVTLNAVDSEFVLVGMDLWRPFIFVLSRNCFLIN